MLQGTGLLRVHAEHITSMPAPQAHTWHLADDTIRKKLKKCVTLLGATAHFDGSGGCLRDSFNRREYLGCPALWHELVAVV